MSNRNNIGDGGGFIFAIVFYYSLYRLFIYILEVI